MLPAPPDRMIAGMKQRLTVHVVDGDMRSRAEQARIVFALGHHAEVYDDLDELLARPPEEGVLLVRQRALDTSLADLFDRLGECGLWLPVVICAPDPRLDQVVEAIKQGALDYLQLPLDPTGLVRVLETVAREARAHGAARRRLNYARARVKTLTGREREVLEWLTEGSSNKIIARELEISPRTVEIHRANMMAKMGARHAAEAVRLWLESGLESTVGPSKGESASDNEVAALERPVRDRRWGETDGEERRRASARQRQ